MVLIVINNLIVFRPIPRRFVSVSFLLISLLAWGMVACSQPITENASDTSVADLSPDLTPTVTPRTGFFPDNVKDWATTLQSAFTVTAIIVGTWLGILRFGWFRTREPHVSISHAVSHREVGANYTHLSVDITIINTSKVLLPFRKGFVVVQQVSPVEDEQALDFQGSQGAFQWKTLKVRHAEWDENSFVVEPGERENQTFQFLIDRQVETVLIQSYFYNERVVGNDSRISPRERPRRKRLGIWQIKGPRGWGRATVYDLNRPVALLL